jgi:hypothetical protein
MNVLNLRLDLAHRPQSGDLAPVYQVTINTPKKMLGVPIMATRPKPDAMCRNTNRAISRGRGSYLLQRFAKLHTRQTKMKKNQIRRGLDCSAMRVRCTRAAAQARKRTRKVGNDVQLTVPMTKKAEFVVAGTLRIGGNLTTAVDERWGVGFNYKLNQYVTLSQLILQSREAAAANGRPVNAETRLALGATLQKPIGKFTLSDRNAFERRWRSPQVDAWRYRNRFAPRIIRSRSTRQVSPGLFQTRSSTIGACMIG